MLIWSAVVTSWTRVKCYNLSSRYIGCCFNFLKAFAIVSRMAETPLRVLTVVGGLHRESVTRTVITHVAERFRIAGASVDILDFQKEPLALYNPDTAYDLPGYVEL